MRPEDIDKLFSERLDGATPTPPAYLWNRLQQRIQEEQPEAAPEQAKQKKKGFNFMWLSSSMAAAAVSLLLAVGIVFYNIRTGTPEISQTLAGEEQPTLQEVPVQAAPAPELAQAPIAALPVEPGSAEIISPPQATQPSPLASSPVEKRASAGRNAKPDRLYTAKARATDVKQTQASAQQALVVAPVQAVAAEQPKTPATAIAADLNAEPVEIIIKRAVAAETALPENETPAGVDKKARLAKNIFKQVRNLANGQRVELSELGIRTDKVVLETQIGKQKFSKVIQL